MQWLLLFLAGLIEKLVTWFINRGLKTVGVIISYISIYIGLYIAFIVTTTLAFWALEPLLPDFVPFVLSMFPPVAFAMMNLYFVSLVARRVFDWNKRVLSDMYSAMNSMRL